MDSQFLKKVITFTSIILLLSGCSKNTIIFENGDENNPTNTGITLVTFNAAVEGRNLQTRAMSPMEKGIQNRLFAFKSPAASTQDSPIAEGLYITSSPGVLIGTDGYKMYLENGVYNFYAVSDNFSTIPPKFTNGTSEPLFNGIDYLWWHSTQQDVISTQINIPIVYLHTATQTVFKLVEGDSIKLDKLISATITPSKPGASMNLQTGIIPPAQTYGVADKMGINGLLCQYIMLPLETSNPMTLTLELIVNGEATSRTYTVEVPVPDGALKAGCSYLFEALINASTVTFPSVSIKHWTDVDETGKPLYPTLE
ncbi:fimbrillin family protein [Parabacteroides sp. AM08-6]|uniref:fimbrillin family protein n=1 Tax=Parabacteroides sp. AM08-6 TaxID=2292053 RepID=UPI000F005FDB|nr:fimbrillin family protein [Parabacteroides sp. AM08-6]RHJ83198.1 fimbrillin family protein [Parabacteroides sp. AM08-6]